MAVMAIISAYHIRGIFTPRPWLDSFLQCNACVRGTAVKGKSENDKKVNLSAAAPAPPGIRRIQIEGDLAPHLVSRSAAPVMLQKYAAELTNTSLKRRVVHRRKGWEKRPREPL